MTTRKEETRAAIAATSARLKELKAEQDADLAQARARYTAERRRQTEIDRLTVELDTLRRRQRHVIVAEVKDKHGRLHTITRKRNDPDGPLVYNYSDTRLSDLLRELADRYSSPDSEVYRALILMTAKH
jgi:hypothetical protein